MKKHSEEVCGRYKIELVCVYIDGIGFVVHRGCLESCTAGWISSVHVCPVLAGGLPRMRLTAKRRRRSILQPSRVTSLSH